jgi:type I restriction enzyme R subunit
VAWLYKHDPSLKIPYQDNLSALIHEPTFKALAGEAVFNKARIIARLGNQAVHSPRPVPPADALTAVGELFHIGHWLARTYARGAKPSPELVFDPAALREFPYIPGQTLDQLQRLESATQSQCYAIPNDDRHQPIQNSINQPKDNTDNKTQTEDQAYLMGALEFE